MDLYNIKDEKTYKEAYNLSINSPERFWEEIASKNFNWLKPWSKY